MGKNHLNLTATISVESMLPEFSSIDPFTVNLKKTTWDEVLIRNGIQINPDIHCLKSADRKIVLLPNEKVETYLASFKRRKSCKVLLTAISTRDRKKIADKTKVNKKPSRTKNSPKKLAFVRKLASDPPGSFSQNNVPNFVRNNLFQQPRFPEDGFMGDEEVINQNFGGQAFDQDFDDSASQDSQDSQLGLEDIKSAAINRLIKGTTNGVMHNVRNELLALKERPNFMKVARYLPLTITMLDHMFKDA